MMRSCHSHGARSVHSARVRRSVPPAPASMRTPMSAGPIVGWGAGPYPRPARSARALRLAFVGQATYFEACALESSPRGCGRASSSSAPAPTPTRCSRRSRPSRPHVVVVFRPEILPPGVFAGLRAAVLGFLTEPVPRTRGNRAHPDLKRRRAALAAMDTGNVDRLVAFDPLIVPTAERVHAGVALAPAAGRGPALRARPRRPAAARRSCSSAARPSTASASCAARRPSWTSSTPRSGSAPDELARLMARARDRASTCTTSRTRRSRTASACTWPRASSSSPRRCRPTHGLEPDIDYLEVADAGPARRGPARRGRASRAAYSRVRVRGRRKAEAFRASHVYPRLIDDLLRRPARLRHPRAAAA